MNVTQQKLISEPFNKKAKKVKCCERASLCGTSFFSYSPKHHTQLFTALYPSVNRSLTLCMDVFKNGLKAFVSLNRDWLEGTELKLLQVSVTEYQVSKTSLY